MKMSCSRPKSLKDCLHHAGGQYLWGAVASCATGDLLRGTSLRESPAVCAGRSVLIATRSQLATALALIELDGVARRIVICPPDVPMARFPSVIREAEVDAIVSDYEPHDHAFPAGVCRVLCGSVQPAETTTPEYHSTEWVLLTSGSTGMPKMIVHNLASLTEPIWPSLDDGGRDNGNPVVWGTFYDIRRYGGLQIFLRAMVGNSSLVLSSAGEPVAEHLERLGKHGVTHLSGTPSHWRHALMSAAARKIAPHYIRLSGEIADQAILNLLHSFYPASQISQAFASTEAGVAFEVKDCLAGFPASYSGKQNGVEIRVVNDSLQIRSDRIALRYVGDAGGSLTNGDGFVETGDIVELRENRYYFLGRRNGIINIGGLKVYPEEIEAVINSHPAVRMSLVTARRNPITGSVVSADIVLKETALKEVPGEGDVPERLAKFRKEVVEICRQRLPAHKVPATLRCVSELRVAAAGKLVRPQHA